MDFRGKLTDEGQVLSNRNCSSRREHQRHNRTSDELCSLVVGWKILQATCELESSRAIQVVQETHFGVLGSLYGVNNVPCQGTK